MNAIKIVFISWFLMYDHVVVGKRISEWKCEDVALIDSTDPRSENPHLMAIVESIQNEIIPISLATIISEDFVLTSASCLPRHISVHLIQVVKFDTEYSKVFNVKRIIRYDKFSWNVFAIYDIALIQLTASLSFYELNSIFRPACIWTNNSIDLSSNYTIYGMRESRLKNMSLTTTPTNECLGYNTQRDNSTDVISSHFCFHTNSHFSIDVGSPVLAKVENEIYIYGIIAASRYNNNTNIMNLGPRITDSILSWIETIVWPNFTPKICGRQKVKINHVALMTHSPEAYPGQFPWHVGIFDNGYFCGGTIIGSSTILTVAHCVYNKLPGYIRILAGTNNITNQDSKSFFGVKEIIVHHNYSYNRQHDNDIAILMLNNSMQFSMYIQPICIKNNWDDFNFTTGEVAGWGLNSNYVQPSLLHYAKIPFVENFDCGKPLTETKYCAGYDNGTSACLGDSGGGMIVQYESRWYIRGIVSTGFAIPNLNICDVTEIILFTNVTMFYDWIVKHLE